MERVQVERAQIETQTQAQVSSGIICARSQHKQRSKVCSCCVSRGRWTSAPKCKQNLKDKYALKKLTNLVGEQSNLSHDARIKVNTMFAFPIFFKKIHPTTSLTNLLTNKLAKYPLKDHNNHHFHHGHGFYGWFALRMEAPGFTGTEIIKSGRKS